MRTLRPEDPGRVDRVAPAWIFATLGFGPQLAQVVFMRELFSTFRGTELAVAIALAAWMVWVAAGSAVAGVMVHRLGRIRSWLAATSLVLAVLMPATLVPLRALRGWLPLPTGEAPPPGWLVPVAFTALLPVCFLTGAQFVLASVLSGRPSKIYALESFGAALAGALLTWGLLPHLNHTAILMIASGAPLTVCVWLFRRRAAAATAIAAWAASLLASPGIEGALQRLYWRQFHAGFELIESRPSRYGSLALIRYRDQYTLYRDGHPVADFPDRGEGAPAAHLVMLQHPCPDRILMIGGGLTGTLKEVLLHPVHRVDYVELDPVALEIGRPRLGPEDIRALQDSRVRIIHKDGRAFVMSADTLYNLIFVQAPDPATLRSNRFYTLEFFQAVRRILTPDGVFALGHPLGPGTGWSDTLLEKLRSIRATLLEVFPNVRMAPGTSVVFLAGEEVTLEEAILVERMMGRLAEPAFIFGYTEPESVRRLEQEVITGKPYDPFAVEAVSVPLPVEVNRDLKPTVPFLAVLGRLEAARAPSFRYLRHLRGVPGWVLLLVLAGIAGPAWFAIHRSDGRRTAGVAVAAAALGFFAMSAQLCLLLVFQGKFGFLFEAIGALFACFMLGAGLGSLWGPARGPVRWPAVCTGAAAVTTASLALTPALGNLAAMALLAGGIFSIGFATGSGFGLAVSAAGNSRGTGAIYAGDVTGGCAAALAIPLWLLPTAGAVSAGLVAAASLAVATVLIAMSARAGRRGPG